MANITVGFAADGVQKTHATIAAAFSAASNGDNLQIFYSDASKNRFWTDINISDTTTKVLSLEGMLAGRQVTFTHKETQLNWYRMNGDLSGQAVQVTIQNLTVNAFDANTEDGIRYEDSSGSGGGVRITNCVFMGFRFGVLVGAANAANVVQIDNCLFLECSRGVNLTSASLLYFLTVIACTNGINNGNTASTIKNCVSLWNNTTAFLGLTNVIMSYCVSSDGTATGTGSVTGKSDPDDLDFWGDAMADIEGGARAVDFRIVDSSDLDVAGNPVAGITTDCDGNTRDVTTPSVGWHEGTARAYEISTAVAANLDIDLNPEVSAAGVAFAIDGQTVTFTGGLTAAADISGISVVLAVYNDENLSSLNATLIAATQQDLSANVQRNWSTINGVAVTWTPDPGNYWIQAFVNGGSPDVGSPDLILPFRVVHDFSTPVLAVVDDGDGSVTLTVTQNQDTGGTDQVSRIKYKLRGAASWTTHGTTVTGDGVISDLTGLTQTSTYQFLAQPFDSDTGLEGPPSKVITQRMAASGEALLDQILDSVNEQLNNLSLTDVDSSTITATVAIPPAWEDVTTAAILVFPDGPETEPARSQVNLETYRINVGLCEHKEGAPNKANLLTNRQAIVRAFVGSRLDSINNVYCQGESSTSAVDLDALYERYKWISVITLEFVVLTARG